jgi:hypothetical protein
MLPAATISISEVSPAYVEGSSNGTTWIGNITISNYDGFFQSDSVSIQTVGLIPGKNLNIPGGQKIISEVDNLGNPVGNWYIGQASDRGNPQAGVIGDIQSSTVSGLSTAVKNAFLKANLVQAVSERATSDEYVFHSPGINRAFSGGVLSQLPGTISGNLWYVSGSTVEVSMGGTAHQLIEIRSNVPLTQRNDFVPDACPRFSGTPSISGCFGCPGGAILTFTAANSCGRSSSCLIVYNSTTSCTLGSQTLLIDEVPTTYSTFLYCAQPVVSGFVALVSGSITAQFPVNGVLDPLELPEDTLEANITVVVDDPPSELALGNPVPNWAATAQNWFAGLFGGDSLLGQLLTGLMYALGALLIIYLMKMMFTVLTSRRSEKML